MKPCTLKQVRAVRSRAAYLASCKLVADHFGLELVAVVDPKVSQRAVRHGPIRQISKYIAVCGFGICQSDIARAAGVTRQTLHHYLREVEDRRDDPDFDALLRSLEQKITTTISAGIVQ